MERSSDRAKRIHKKSLDDRGLGEPIFAYPPMVFGERDPNLSNWFHIGIINLTE